MSAGWSALAEWYLERRQCHRGPDRRAEKWRDTRGFLSWDLKQKFNMPHVRTPSPGLTWAARICYTALAGAAKPGFGSGGVSAHKGSPPKRRANLPRKGHLDNYQGALCV